MKKKRWNNEPWDPNKRTLKKIHNLKKANWSYREIGTFFNKDHTTISKYYKLWILKKPWFFRLFNWFTKNERKN